MEGDRDLASREWDGMLYGGSAIPFCALKSQASATPHEGAADLPSSCFLYSPQAPWLPLLHSFSKDASS
jgi:hypothetical protein